MTKPLSLRSGSRSLLARAPQNVTVPEAGRRVPGPSLDLGIGYARSNSARQTFVSCGRPDDSASQALHGKITFGQNSLDRRSPTASDEFQDLAAQCIVSCIELVDHRKVIVQLHTREARACAVTFA